MRVEVKTKLVHLTPCYFSGEPSIGSGKNGDQIRWKYAIWRENRHMVHGPKLPLLLCPSVGFWAQSKLAVQNAKWHLEPLNRLKL